VVITGSQSSSNADLVTFIVARFHLLSLNISELALRLRLWRTGKATVIIWIHSILQASPSDARSGWMNRRPGELEDGVK
jgi:hypothetical protein